MLRRGKRARITLDGHAIIIRRALEHPRLQRTKLAEKLQRELEERGHDVPQVEVLERLISKHRNHSEDDPQEKPWSTATLDAYPIPPEALGAVLKAWRSRVLQRETFTVREAKWCARLSGVPLSDVPSYEELSGMAPSRTGIPVVVQESSDGGVADPFVAKATFTDVAAASVPTPGRITMTGTYDRRLQERIEGNQMDAFRTEVLFAKAGQYARTELMCELLGRDFDSTLLDRWLMGLSVTIRKGSLEDLLPLLAEEKDGVEQLQEVKAGKRRSLAIRPYGENTISEQSAHLSPTLAQQLSDMEVGHK